MKQVLTAPDASGLTPLKLPAGLARREGDNARPAPSQDAISRFQAAMGEPQPIPRLVPSAKFLVQNLDAEPDTHPELSIFHSPLSTSATSATPTSVSLSVSDITEGTGNG